jgi:hypothetical protein
MKELPASEDRSHRTMDAEDMVGILYQATTGEEQCNKSNYKSKPHN